MDAQSTVKCSCEKNLQENNTETDSLSATDNSSEIFDCSAEDRRSVDFETLEPTDSTGNKFGEDNEIPLN